jgi:hypothetical protein
MNRAAVILLLSLFSSVNISQENEPTFVSGAYIPIDSNQKYFTNLNLKYEPEFDYYFCDNNPELCNKIQEDRFLPKFEIYQKASNYSWATFWALQILDVYSTKKGLEYDCVKEMNPLLPERPSTAHVILHKGIVFGIPYVNNNWKDTVTDAELLTANLITGVVVLNNFDVIDGARSSCTKIR